MRKPPPTWKRDLAEAGRDYARQHGYRSRRGGIYTPGGKRVARRWETLARDLARRGTLPGDQLPAR